MKRGRPRVDNLKKRHPLYNTWGKMKSRCYNPNNIRYDRYGGRGIRVCARWMNSFQAFVEDMGEKPTPGHQLDRIDNDGNYEPSNCGWATRAEQTYNQGLRATNKSGHKGINWNKRHGRWYVYVGGAKDGKMAGSSKSLEEAIRMKEDYIKKHGHPYENLLKNRKGPPVK
jgi:hypothetical protein